MPWPVERFALKSGGTRTYSAAGAIPLFVPFSFIRASVLKNICPESLLGSPVVCLALAGCGCSKWPVDHVCSCGLRSGLEDGVFWLMLAHL